jgi:hypothetical protein
MKKMLLVVFIICSCNTIKTDEMKIIEMDYQFDQAMKENTYFCYDTIRSPKIKEPLFFVEYVYDSTNGVKSLILNYSAGGLKHYEQASFLKGKLYKAKIDTRPDTVKSGTKYKPDVLMYYIIDGRVIPKINDDSINNELILEMSHSKDSLVYKFQERLKLK